MKKVESNKIRFLNKKNLKILGINNFHPGSIVAHITSNNTETSRYIYLDREDFEKLEGKEWFNKHEMENILSFNEETNLKDTPKLNYESSFYFYDLDEKLKFNQVVENIYYIFN